MARNRKNDSNFKLAPVFTALLLCGLFMTLGVGYVWYKNQSDVLCTQITARENHLAELRRQNQMMREQLRRLCLPKELEARVKKLNLNLGPAAPDQVVRLVESSPNYDPSFPRVGGNGKPLALVAPHE